MKILEALVSFIVLIILVVALLAAVVHLAPVDPDRKNNTEFRHFSGWDRP